MTENDLKIETDARRFLLGDLSGGEQLAFEENFIADADLFERVRVVEDELIESYVRETLAPAERAKFEKCFLATDARRRRVAFTRTMLDELAARQERAVVVAEVEAAKPTVWDSIAALFKTPSLAFGAAFALLVLIFGGWLLLRNQKTVEVARQTTPTPTIKKIETNANIISPPNENASVNSNEVAPEKNSDNKNIAAPNVNRETPKRNPNPNPPTQNIITPTLALFAGMTRADGKMPELNLPKGARTANLRLNLESQDYKIYRAAVVDVDGKVVWQNEKLKAKKSKINFHVPAEKLLRGDYLVKVSADNPRGASEPVADYAFRVNRK